jgi:rhodanese-related sulfurtransferase
MWVGALIEDINQKIVLICPEGKEEEAAIRLSRVGYDGAVGFLKGGVQAYVDNGGELKNIESVSAETLEKLHDDIEIVDVRKPGEYASERIEKAIQVPLDYIVDHMDELDKDKTYYAHCAGGYRSVIAISLLMQHGYEHLINVLGGFNDIKKTNIPKTDYVCPTTL